MKDLFPNNARVETLKIEGGKILLFTPLTEEEHNNFKFELQRYNTTPKSSGKREELNKELYKIVKFTFDDVIAIGDTKLETRLANQYIDSVIWSTGDIGRDRIKKRSFKCFAGNDWKGSNQMNMPYHEDGGCAWNCLIQSLGSPKYGIIYTKKYES